MGRFGSEESGRRGFGLLNLVLEEGVEPSYPVKDAGF